MEKLIERVKSILLNPKETWEIIKSEEETQMSIIKNYLLILAAIPPVASFIGQVIVGTTIPLVGHYRIPFFTGLIWAILQYVLLIAGIYISAIVVNALAPNFGGAKNNIAAFKLVAYTYTVPLVAGVLDLVPTLSVIAFLLSLYGIYVFYLGLPVMMGNPKEKTTSYTVVAILVIIVVLVIVQGVAGLVLGSTVPHY